jgi:hypothetical protein
MKRSIPAFVVLGVALLYWGCSENGPVVSEPGQDEQVTESLGKKPAAHLSGMMDLDFMGPMGPYVWVGTVDLEGYGQFGMRFIHTSGPARDYSMARPFEEIFEIYDPGNPTIVCLAGTDAGVTTLANSKFRMNGVVEVATGPFEMWLGRNVHMSGIISWQTLLDGAVIPETAVGPFRVN